VMYHVSSRLCRVPSLQQHGSRRVNIVTRRSFTSKPPGGNKGGGKETFTDPQKPTVVEKKKPVMPIKPPTPNPVAVEALRKTAAASKPSYSPLFVVLGMTGLAVGSYFFLPPDVKKTVDDVFTPWVDEGKKLYQSVVGGDKPKKEEKKTVAAVAPIEVKKKEEIQEKPAEKKESKPEPKKEEPAAPKIVVPVPVKKSEPMSPEQIKEGKEFLSNLEGLFDHIAKSPSPPPPAKADNSPPAAPQKSPAEKPTENVAEEAPAVEKEEKVSREKIEQDEEAAKRELEQLREKIAQEISQELNKEVEKMISEVEHKYHYALLEQEQQFTDEIGRILKEKDRLSDKNVERLKAMSELKKRVSGLEEVLSWHQQYEAVSGRVNILSNAMMKMEEQIKKRQPLKTSLSLISAVSSAENSLVRGTVASIPKKVVDSGIADIDGLKSRFDEVENAARKADLVQEAEGMFSVLLSSVFSSLLAKERHLSRGTDNQAKLSRAGFFLEHGDLLSCAQELESLEGLPKSIVRDWVDEAKGVLAAQRAFKVVKADVICMSANLAVSPPK
jgi:hypothetical protein